MKRGMEREDGSSRADLGKAARKGKIPRVG